MPTKCNPVLSLLEIHPMTLPHSFITKNFSCKNFLIQVIHPMTLPHSFITKNFSCKDFLIQVILL